MAESHVISGLVAKRSEMAGLIQHYQAEISRISTDLNHIDATIKLFSPEFDLRTVRAKAHRERSHSFTHGERPRLILDILRESVDGLTSGEIAEAMLRLKGVESNANRIEQFQRCALSALNKLEAKGLVAPSETEGAARIWKIA
ncbi:hypothetical protein F6R98_19710 [Candidatus Methylospira mobilis]|uniref:Uncharacterized protein n=1 Tax=Candidatus Methylospira mobilis TaxID=1808979 RepID=A0A5Q0BLU7_9GAMM|nr:hypothetical protein [Candidatus Methylospira mobilis]QFY44579.1 hypothetical protein F6R98_19710 [Candidatus Methylospira mobilis]